MYHKFNTNAILLTKLTYSLDGLCFIGKTECGQNIEMKDDINNKLWFLQIVKVAILI